MNILFQSKTPMGKVEGTLHVAFWLLVVAAVVSSCSDAPATYYKEQRPATDVPITFAAPGEMTLRDWFAGQWLAGAASRGELGFIQSRSNTAYEWADAMLRARQIEVKDE